MTKRILEGVKVLEFAELVAGPFCGKLLADLGADVIKVEPPERGDEARRRGPFLKDIPHPERSSLFLYLNTNKRSITLNPETTAGEKLFKELVKETDIFIEDNPLRFKEGTALEYKYLKNLNSRLIVISVTPFGQTGSYTEYKAYPLNVYHGGGLGYITPRDSPNLEREPLKAGGLMGEYACGLNAAIAALAALYAQGPTDTGQYVDISKQRALISLQRVHLAFYPNYGDIPTRMTPPSGMGGIIKCKDGHIVLSFIEDHHWSALAKIIGKPEWAKDENFRNVSFRAAHYEDIIEPAILEWTLGLTKEEIRSRVQPMLPCGPVLSPAEVAETEQMKERGFFVEIEHPEAGRLRYPSLPFQLLGISQSEDHPAPLLGEHNEDIYCGRLGYSREDLANLRHSDAI